MTYPPNAYSFTITGSVIAMHSTFKEASFKIRFISPCPSAILTATSQTNPADYAYTGSSAPAIFTLNPFTISPALCTVEYSCKMNTVANFDLCTIGNFNSVTGQLIISTEDFVTYPPNVYSFRITGSVIATPSTF